MHVDEAVLAPLRERYGEPVRLEWKGEISGREHSLASYNPSRTHDVTLFIFNGERLALIRKHGFEPGIWRPPGGGIKLGEDFVAGVQREALEETGLHVELHRYLVDAAARFVYVPEASLAMPAGGRAGLAALPVRPRSLLGTGVTYSDAEGTTCLGGRTSFWQRLRTASWSRATQVKSRQPVGARSRS